MSSLHLQEHIDGQFVFITEGDADMFARWLLFWKTELQFFLLSWNRRGDVKAPPNTHLSQLLWTLRRAGSNRAASPNNGREAGDTRGCAHGGSLRASITRYGTLPLCGLRFCLFVFVCLLFFFLLISVKWCKNVCKILWGCRTSV